MYTYSVYVYVPACSTHVNNTKSESGSLPIAVAAHTIVYLLLLAPSVCFAVFLVTLLRTEKMFTSLFALLVLPSVFSQLRSRVCPLGSYTVLRQLRIRSAHVRVFIATEMFHCQGIAL